MDAAVARLNDAAMSRAINGVAVPIFHNGEQIAERRHYDERLTMFLLRYRDPLIYGKWRDREQLTGHAEGSFARLHKGIADTASDAAAAPGDSRALYRKRVREIGREIGHEIEEAIEEDEDEAPGEDEGDVA
jgi:hypothetical protein